MCVFCSWRIPHVHREHLLFYFCLLLSSVSLSVQIVGVSTYTTTFVRACAWNWWMTQTRYSLYTASRLVLFHAKKDFFLRFSLLLLLVRNAHSNKCRWDGRELTRGTLGGWERKRARASGIDQNYYVLYCVNRIEQCAKTLERAAREKTRTSTIDRSTNRQTDATNGMEIRKRERGRETGINSKEFIKEKMVNTNVNLSIV